MNLRPTQSSYKCSIEDFSLEWTEQSKWMKNDSNSTHILIDIHGGFAGTSKSCLVHLYWDITSCTEVTEITPKLCSCCNDY